MGYANLFWLPWLLSSGLIRALKYFWPSRAQRWMKIELYVVVALCIEFTLGQIYLIMRYFHKIGHENMHMYTQECSVGINRLGYYNFIFVYVMSTLLAVIFIAYTIVIVTCCPCWIGLYYYLTNEEEVVS